MHVPKTIPQQTVRTRKETELNDIKWVSILNVRRLLLKRPHLSQRTIGRLHRFYNLTRPISIILCRYVNLPRSDYGL